MVGLWMRTGFRDAVYFRICAGDGAGSQELSCCGSYDGRLAEALCLWLVLNIERSKWLGGDLALIASDLAIGPE